MKKEKKAKASAEEAEQESAVVGEETESVSGETPPNELHEPFWSVVSFEGRIASNLTYDEAVEKMRSLEEEKTPGLCIVTNAAAQRIRPQ
jgi:hypothetical protein